MDFSKRYSSEAEALAAREQIYGDTSIYLSAKADQLNSFATSNNRSDSAYYYGCAEAGKHYFNGEKQIETARAFWADFQNDATYKALQQKGGASTKEELSRLLSAAERYRWQKSYKEYGVYEQDMFDFADKLTENTGVTVVTKGRDDEISFDNDDSICRLDNYTFQFMATHQEHMDLWENVVKGKYNSFRDITKAVKETGDEGLIADWHNAEPYGYEKQFFHSSNKYASASSYAGLSLPGYGSDEEFNNSSRPGITVKDFWNEFRFNTGITDELTGKFSMSGTINEDGSMEYNTSDWLDPDKQKLSGASLLGLDKKKSQAAVSPMDKYQEQIGNIKEKMKQVRSHLSVLQKYSAGQEDEAIQKQIAAAQKQLASYQRQLESIQLQSLEYQKQHLTH